MWGTACVCFTDVFIPDACATGPQADVHWGPTPKGSVVWNVTLACGHISPGSECRGRGTERT